MFYKYKNQGERVSIPVYLVDEEIYAKCPTIILSTVDKFARLPWDVNTNTLFGRVDRKCSRDGYIAIGAKHPKHRKTDKLEAATITSAKPFLPPELIIQDELHLITGPLGTVYGAYETIIEDMCTHDASSPSMWSPLRRSRTQTTRQRACTQGRIQRSSLRMALRLETASSYGRFRLKRNRSEVCRHLRSGTVSEDHPPENLRHHPAGRL